MARKKESYDFQGWATAYNIQCADERVLMPGAFDECDGSRVPLVYQHNHTDIGAVLGHADLECRDEGVYMYGKFSDTPNGQNAKRLVQDGSIRSLSINANHLVQQGKAVMHGIIREVSLVLAGANPKATIEFPELAHGLLWNPDDADEIIAHTIRLDGSGFGEEGGSRMSNYDPDWLEHDDDGNSETLGEAFDRTMGGLDESQRAVIEAMIGAVAEASEADDDDPDYDDEEEEVDHSMPYNVFDGYDGGGEISHAELLSGMVQEAVDSYDGSLKEAALSHGIDNIELLFPPPHDVNREPVILDRDQTWVDIFLNACKKVPFYRVRNSMANITEDEARALGYIRGNRKKDEVFKILRRKTSSQTIYKRQHLDRDDLLEVTEFDLANWIMREMRGKLKEELARASLLGDGRSSDSEDKIHEDNVRPIWKDDDLFTIKSIIPVTAQDNLNTQAKSIIRAAVIARTRYRGSGRPTMFIDPTTLAQMLLIEDLNGHRLYESEASLAAAMRVSKIVEVPIMENIFDSDDTSTRKMLCAIIVNPNDYTLGSGKGGEVTSFSDFDINYNKYTYLIETRMCGTLTEAYSAIALFFPAGFIPAWYVEGGTMNYTRDFEAALGDVAAPTVEYFVAAPVPTDNPRQNGWFERSGSEGSYVYGETTDVVPDENKTYYVRRVTRNVTGFSVS